MLPKTAATTTTWSVLMDYPFVQGETASRTPPRLHLDLAGQYPRPTALGEFQKILNHVRYDPYGQIDPVGAADRPSIAAERPVCLLHSGGIRQHGQGRRQARRIDPVDFGSHC